MMPGRVRLDYSLMVGEVPAERIKRQADLDRNGELSDSEQKQLVDSLVATVQRDVSVQMDGQKISAPFVSQPLTLKSPKVESTPFALELQTDLPIPNQPSLHTLVVDDRADIPPVGEIELRIEEGPGVELLSAESGSTKPQSNQSSSPNPIQNAPTLLTETKVPTLFRQFGPPRSLLSDRSVTMRFQLRTQSPQASPRRFTYGLGVFSLLILCGLGLFARRFLRS